MTTFKPYIAATTKSSEFTLRAVILGVLLGLLFGVGNAYLGLKVGTTVSASIPAAVLSMAILRVFFKRVSILENNLVQTIASVGEGLAAGVIFTVPALFLLGAPPSPFRIFLLSALGGVLGVLFMIPMRRYIIVHEHGKLPFPEGTACAEILKSGEAGRSKALFAGIGILVGALHKICSSALYLWNEVLSWVISPFQRTEFSIDCTPSLLGVGYIIGPRIASLLFGGAALGWWVLIPLIRLFGEGTNIIYPSTVAINQMTVDDIWSNYIRYIGAGTVAIGGMLGLLKIAPLVGKTLKMSFGELFQGSGRRHLARTDQDISLRWLVIGSVAIILTLWLFPGLPMNFLTILLLVVLGFFFVAVVSMTVGLVGSTSNPVSGMTITTLLATCLVFVLLGWTERAYLLAALTMSVVANVAIALAGTTSQDLKTGYILGATPRLQQIGEIIGILLPALAIGSTVYLLNTAYGIGSKSMPAPQGTMMALVAEGVISGNIPFTLVITGIIIGLILFCLKLPVLPFAIGLYLPLSLSTPIMVGGIVSALARHFSKKKEATQDRGVLLASGLVAGDAFTGVVIALLTVVGWVKPSGEGLLHNIFSLSIFAALAVGLAWFSMRPPAFFTKKD
jgi:putative OPT family oligopeptide transporter